MFFLFLFSFSDVVIQLFFFFNSQELMNQPVSMTCGHSACKACLHTMMYNTTLRKTCPLCRERITPGNLNINIAVRALISKIIVRCINVGCEWVGEHRNINDHSVNCQFMLVNCPNGCIEKYRRSGMDEHLAVCPSQRLPCGFCNVGVSRRDLGTHEKNCPDGPRQCPLECGERMQR